MSVSFRHELKYFISLAEYGLLSRKLALTMERDEYAKQTGKYFIRSLYFDDYMDTAMQDKLDGSDHRDKYRIRIYNFKDTDIKLERKHKEGQFIQKSSLGLTRQECDALIAGNCTFLLRRREPFAHEMYAAFRTQLLRPRVLVDYDREPYVFPVEDVRVTFDQDIRTAYRSIALFDPEIPTYPVIDGYGMVMEVKFNRYLPAYIQTLLQPLENAQRSAISKYCLCRRYE